jgi:hypothetical protein
MPTRDEDDDEFEEEDEDDDEDELNEDEEDEESTEITKEDLLEDIDVALQGLDDYIASDLRVSDDSIELELNDDSRWRVTLRKIS